MRIGFVFELQNCKRQCTKKNKTIWRKFLKVCMIAIPLAFCYCHGILLYCFEQNLWQTKYMSGVYVCNAIDADLKPQLHCFKHFSRCLHGQYTEPWWFGRQIFNVQYVWRDRVSNICEGVRCTVYPSIPIRNALECFNSTE